MVTGADFDAGPNRQSEQRPCIVAHVDFSAGFLDDGDLSLYSLHQLRLGQLVVAVALFEAAIAERFFDQGTIVAVRRDGQGDKLPVASVSVVLTSVVDTVDKSVVNTPTMAFWPLLRAW